MGFVDSLMHTTVDSLDSYRNFYLYTKISFQKFEWASFLWPHLRKWPDGLSASKSYYHQETIAFLTKSRLPCGPQNYFNDSNGDDIKDENCWNCSKYIKSLVDDLQVWFSNMTYIETDAKKRNWPKNWLLIKNPYFLSASLNLGWKNFVIKFFLFFLLQVSPGTLAGK